MFRAMTEQPVGYRHRWLPITSACYRHTKSAITGWCSDG